MLNLALYASFKNLQHHFSTVLYLSMVPAGTYSVALKYVYSLNNLFMVNGFSTLEKIFNISQHMNADSPILVTLLGIMIDIRSVQPQKAPLPIVTTPLGIETEVSFTQLSICKCFYISHLYIKR